MCSRLRQLASGSMLSLSLCNDIDCACMKGGKVLWCMIINGYDFNVERARFAIRCCPGSRSNLSTRDRRVYVDGDVGIDML